jgi:hypothetical protein
MINKENDSISDITSFDPRIVHTVRNLKSKPFRHSDETITNHVKEVNEKISQMS